MNTTKVIENIPLVSNTNLLTHIQQGDITLQVTDTKRSFSFKIVTKIFTTYILSNPRIKISTLRSGGIEQYTLDFPDYDILVNDGKKEYVFIANVTKGDPATSSRENLKYQFADKQVYKITYIIDVYDPSPGGRLNKFEYNNRTFTYYENPITFNENNFDFDDNVSYGDKISIKGLALIQTEGDNTIPQSTNNANELISDSDTAGKYILDGITVVDINGSTVALQLAPFVTPAIEFNFEDAEEDFTGTNNDDTTYTGVGELDAFYRPQVLKFDPTGNYLLPPNNLTIGKIYVVTVTAKWAGGYETSVTSKNHLYILPRPEITGVIKKPLYVDGGQQDVVSISVKKHTDTTISSPPTQIWFNFYDPSNNLVAKAGGIEGVVLNNNDDVNNYSFTLSQLEKVAPYSLVNGVEYTVKAETRYNANNNLQRIIQHRYSD